MPAVVYVEEIEVENRLSDLGLNKEKILDVLRVAFAEHGSCNENDPCGSHGMSVYRWVVRGLREQYRPEGWEINRTGGIESIVNHDLKIRIAFMNTDENTCIIGQAPQNKYKKGANSKLAVLINQDIFPEAESWPVRVSEKTIIANDYATWHLCVNIENDDMCSELSMLSEMEDGYIKDAFERIFILERGEFGPLAPLNSDKGDSSGGNEGGAPVIIIERKS